MNESKSSKGLVFWTAVISLTAALASLGGNIYLYKAKETEATLRAGAENQAKEAKADAKRQQEAREKLERQRDSLRKFMVNYRTHLLRLKDGFSQLRRAKAFPQDFSQEKLKKLEEDLIVQAMAFTKFLNEWRDVSQAFRSFLNGDADAIEAAAKARNITEIEKRSELLERNIDDKQRVLEEAVSALQ